MDDDHAYSLMTPRVFYLFKYNDWALRWQGVVLRVLSLWLADMVEIYDWHSAMDMPNIYRASDSHELTHHICSKNHYYNSMIHHRPFGPLMTRERSQSWAIHMANFLFLSMSNIKSAGQTSQFKCKFMITISNWSVWYPQLLLVYSFRFELCGWLVIVDLLLGNLNEFSQFNHFHSSVSYHSLFVICIHCPNLNIYVDMVIGGSTRTSACVRTYQSYYQLCWQWTGMGNSLLLCRLAGQANRCDFA